VRISLKWLAELVALPPVEELATGLTSVGLEVEGVEHLGANLAGVVAARIVSSQPHPNADKLSVTSVDAGRGEPLQIVCGAKNYQVGDLVPLATVGAVLPGGQKIERAKLRGVESSGMLCSARELGLSVDAAGLLILPAQIRPGTPVAEALELNDTILEVNVTPNRPDALSHMGIAREVAARFGARLNPARQVELPLDGKAVEGLVKVRIESPERCHRYAARVVEGVRVGPSPAWLARRLESCGVRSISNVVDATNLVLLELGHPLHAFDLDKVGGAEIVVRNARAGERLGTLDGKDRALDADDLVIADRDRASALAGVMGGAHSEIGPQSSRILLESAFFAPAGIRRTARRHDLHSEASHRFERGADPEAVLPALDRCAALIAQLAGGSVCRGRVDVHARPSRPTLVALRWDRPAAVLGAPVSRDWAHRVLISLGFVEGEADDRQGTFRVPSWRVDIGREEDLIEEIARCTGYDAIPETLPGLGDPRPALSSAAAAVGRIREVMAAGGFSEAVNFSFVAPKDLENVHRAGSAPPALALKNPLSAEQSVMRTSLIPGLLRNLELNLHQRVEALRLYELGRLYLPRSGSPDRNPAVGPALEPQRLAAVIAGPRSPVGWAAGRDATDFYDAKSAVEALLEGLGIAGGGFALLEAKPEIFGAAPFHPRHAAAVMAADGTALGAVGEVHPAVADGFGVPRGVLLIDLDADRLVALSRAVPTFGGVPRFPAVLRDLAVVLDDAVPAGQVLELVRAASPDGLVEEVTLFDVYRGAPLPAGKKNLALAIRYRAPDRTLTDEETGRIHDAIVATLGAKLGAEPRRG
jgi:phenylalanyl-tRNA synthetase beta chain